MNEIKTTNQSGNKAEVKISQRDLLLVLLFFISIILVSTCILNWVTVSLHNEKVTAISDELSDTSLEAGKKAELIEKLNYHQTQFDQALSFPRIFFIILIILELAGIVQIFREFLIVPKESSSDEHERFKMKAILIIIPICFLNVIYLLLRFYIFQSFFPRLLFLIIALAMVIFSFLIVFVRPFIELFIPKKAATLDEFENLTKQFESFSMPKDLQNTNSKSDTEKKF